MKTAIFFGAGASRAEGAPLQGELFKQYFEFIKNRKPAYYTSEMEVELRTFFLQMFGLDVDHDDLNRIKFPTFEEAIGILDLAISRNEYLKDYDLENIAANSNRIRQVRVYLVLMMAQIIHEKLRHTGKLHRQLIENLRVNHILKKTIFITSNYDILVDNALTDLMYRTGTITLDYGFDFINMNEGDWKKPDDNAIKLYKLHGSLNWLYCRTCNNVKLTPLEKGIIRLITEIGNATCDYCETLYSPIIIPPTYFKEMNNVFLQQVWNKVEQDLREVEHIIFCGYSFPDADIHIKYLLKRIQTNRQVPRLKFTAINNHNHKSDEEKITEKERFIRFLGRNVNYTNLSFQDFVNRPMEIINLPLVHIAPGRQI